MAIINPWGSIDWLVPKIGNKKWINIACASFEERCIAAPLWINNTQKVNATYILKISPPENEFKNELDRRIELSIEQLSATYNHHIVEVDFNGMIPKLNQLVNQIASENPSVVLDISAMPKRAFLFLTKKLLLNEKVVDLLITYTRPENYKEGQLTNDALPPAALPGFARESEGSNSSTMIVSVGYMGFNLGDLLKQAKGKSLKFMFPFPPGSPSFRRNWRLLHQLTDPDIAVDQDIKRIHAMDMFAAYNWLRTINQEGSLQVDMIPLGPKPHALAMGLAHLKYGARSEIMYSQPQKYYPDYSKGIKLRPDGQPDITCYCLKRDSKSFV